MPSTFRWTRTVYRRGEDGVPVADQTLAGSVAVKADPDERDHLAADAAPHLGVKPHQIHVFDAGRVKDCWVRDRSDLGDYVRYEWKGKAS